MAPGNEKGALFHPINPSRNRETEMATGRALLQRSCRGKPNVFFACNRQSKYLVCLIEQMV